MGNPVPNTSITREILKDRVKKNRETGCLEWTGFLKNGYAAFTFNGKVIRAHRLAFIVANGEIPDGTEINHICGVKHCVNPEHLEAISHGDNIRHHWNSQTSCKRGHPWPENRKFDSRGQRYCTLCRIINNENYRQQERKRNYVW